MIHPGSPTHLLAGRHVHLGVTGSVAAFKAIELLRELVSAEAVVSAALTASARQFVTPLSFSALGAVKVYEEMYPVDSSGADGGDLFAHLRPGMDAELFLVVPATANSLAKFAHGLADDMLSCQALSFPGHMLIAPAMNQRLWSAQATQENVDVLKRRGHLFVGPERGSMACGESGQGRMASIETILLHALRALAPQVLTGKRVLVSLGPTREPFDAIRFWSNGSTGLMGASMALAAWAHGAEVTAVCGPGVAPIPDVIRTVPVTTAREMRHACLDLWPEMDLAVMTAAVSDFAPPPYEGKYKKGEDNGSLRLEFSHNPDILKEMGQKKNSGKQQVLIGFAAESSDLERNAQGKLEAKNLDAIVANPVGEPGIAFGAMDNQALFIARNGTQKKIPRMAKNRAAWKIWDLILTLSH